MGASGSAALDAGSLDRATRYKDLGAQRDAILAQFEDQRTASTDALEAAQAQAVADRIALKAAITKAGLYDIEAELDAIRLASDAKGERVETLIDQLQAQEADVAVDAKA